MATPTGTVRINFDGVQIAFLNLDGSGNASDPFTVPISTTPGTHNITADYSGDSNFPAGSGSAQLTVTAGTQGVVVAVSVTPTTVAQGGAVNINVSVSGN